VGGCRIIERIGQGAMAVVYEAEQLRLSRTVALKVMLPGLPFADEKSTHRFLSEARLAAQLDHSNIVQVYDVGEEAGHHYIVMQFVDGGSVGNLVKQKGKLEVNEALGIVLQAARGLEAAHKWGMIHRDIKPSNLLIDSQGVVKIADFGLAKSLADDTQLTRAGAQVGTPCYMSPEQWRGHKLSIRSDIYALGVTLYYMLVGKPPFEGETTFSLMEKHLNEPVSREPLMQAGIPRPVAALVEKMMAKDPEQRHQDPEELIRDVEGLLAEAPPPPRPTAAFDDRESFGVAEAVLAVIRSRRKDYPDDDAVWEAFIDWRGGGEGEYLRRIRAGGRYIFYAVLQDLYSFAEELCGEHVSREVGRVLSDTLLERHMPDLLRTSLVQTGTLPDQVMWLVGEFVAGTCGEVYSVTVEPRPNDTLLSISLTYRAEQQMVDYLEQSGHEPERAFANSFEVFSGAVRALLARAIYGFRHEQFRSERSALRGRSLLTLRPENRFHYENIIDILLGYVRRLRERKEPDGEPAASEASYHVSAAMKSVWEAIRKAAASDETLLLCGESGTGKSYYARLIHETSGRRHGPFVEVGLTSDVGSDSLIQSNLFGHVRGAFTGAHEQKQGLFALADGGTIFLDEIGDASQELQAKLLRVIENKTFRMLGGLQDISVDVRIIAATNKDLAQGVRQESFREDLYYRVNVIAILLPPLRERREDIPALVRRLFNKVCQEARKPNKRLADGAASILHACAWPGNIRELENALRHAVAFSQGAEVRPEDLPEAVRAALWAPAGGQRVIDRDSLMHALSTIERAPAAPTFEQPGHIDYAKRQYLIALIAHYRGSLKEIARHWDRSSQATLLKLIREFGLEEELHRARKQRQ